MRGRGRVIVFEPNARRDETLVAACGGIGPGGIDLRRRDGGQEELGAGRHQLGAGKIGLRQADACAADRVGDCQRLHAVRPHDEVQGGGRTRMLFVGHHDLGFGRHRGPGGPDVGDHADDRHPLPRVEAALDASADRVVRAERRPHQRLVDDRHKRRVESVGAGGLRELS